MSDDICGFLRESAEEEYHVAADEIERLRAENEKLRAALKPFAGLVKYCEGMTDSESHCVFVGDLRAAAAALKEAGDE